MNYLPDAEAVTRALIAIAAALRPGGLLAFNICLRVITGHKPSTPGSGAGH